MDAEQVEVTLSRYTARDGIEAISVESQESGVLGRVIIYSGAEMPVDTGAYFGDDLYDDISDEAVIATFDDLLDTLSHELRADYAEGFIERDVMKKILGEELFEEWKKTVDTTLRVTGLSRSEAVMAADFPWQFAEEEQS